MHRELHTSSLSTKALSCCFRQYQHASHLQSPSYCYWGPLANLGDTSGTAILATDLHKYRYVVREQALLQQALLQQALLQQALLQQALLQQALLQQACALSHSLLYQ